MQVYDIVFLVTATLFNLLIAAILISEKHKKERQRRLFSFLWFLLAIPLCVVYIYRLSQGWDTRIVIWFSLVLLYILVELLLDVILKVDFRSKAVTHVPYIVLEYAALISLIFIATSIGKVWGYLVGISFWILLGSLVYLYSDRIFKKKV